MLHHPLIGSSGLRLSLVRFSVFFRAAFTFRLSCFGKPASGFGATGLTSWCTSRLQPFLKKTCATARNVLRRVRTRRSVRAAVCHGLSAVSGKQNRSGRSQAPVSRRPKQQWGVSKVGRRVKSNTDTPLFWDSARGRRHEGKKSTPIFSRACLVMRQLQGNCN